MIRDNSQNINLEEVRKFMEQLMLEVGDFLNGNFGKIKDRYYKDGDEVVTNVDVEVEERIKKKIKKSYPGHSILSEENSSLSSSTYLWVVDPLDGTNNFSRGIPIFGSAIALIKDQKVLAGAIVQPILNNKFSADVKSGAFLNGRKLYLSGNHKKLTRAMMDFETRLRKDIDYKLEILRQISSRVSTRMLGSSSNAFAFLLTGGLDIFVTPSTLLWDVAAGALIVKMAGGEVLNLKGEEWSIDDKSLVAINPAVRDKVKDLLLSSKF